MPMRGFINYGPRAKKKQRGAGPSSDEGYEYGQAGNYAAPIDTAGMDRSMIDDLVKKPRRRRGGFLGLFPLGGR